jgi:tetratricopeptide (TPR) repeat protein
MHELVRRYGRDKLDALPADEDAETPGAQVGDRHSRYIATFLEAREADLLGRRPKEASQEILQEMDNVRAAWRWAVERGNVEIIGDCVRAIEEVTEPRGWYHEVNQMYGSAAAMIRKQLREDSPTHGDAAGDDMRIVLAEILRSQAQQYLHLGLRQRFRELCEESLELLRDAGQSLRQKAATGRAMAAFGWNLWTLGDSARGEQLMRTALSLYEEVHDLRGRASALMLLAEPPRHLGRYERAKSLYNQAISAAGEAGDLRLKAWCLGTLSEVLCDKGQYDRARLLAEEGLEISQELNDWLGIAHSHGRMGDIAAVSGDYELARQHYEAMQALSDEMSMLGTTAAALRGLGNVALGLGHNAEAKQWFEESLASMRKLEGREDIGDLLGLGHATCALGELNRSAQWFASCLELATKLNRTRDVLDALVGTAHLLVRQGQQERATEVLAFALHQPGTRQVTRERAQDLIAGLQSQLAPDAFAGATECGRTHELEEVAVGILEQLSLRAEE